LTFWRPQRAGLGGEPKFMDMGHLRYGIPIALDGREIGCGVGAFSELSPTLAPAAGTSGPYNQLFPLQDSADDAAPSPARTLSLTLDVGACLRAHGVDPTGQQVRLPLEAVTESRPGGTDRTAQTIAVCLPGCTPPASGGPAGGNTDGGPTNSEHPDLSIASVTGTDAGGDCQLTIQIANRGTAMSAPSDTRIQAGGGASSTDSTVTTQSIPAGGSEATVTTIPGSCAGRTFTVTADSAGSIAELDEANNAWTGGA
jgi:hypothetical protein